VPNYPRLKAMAERLIAKAGQPATLVRATRVGGNPKDPRTGTVTPANHAVKVVETEYDIREIDGTVILRSDRRFLMSTEGLGQVDPNSADALIVGGKTLQVVSMKPLQPGGVVLLYDVQARGG
jgi:hypothetical protein